MLWRWLGMPGNSHEGAPSPLDEDARALSADLERDVRTLSSEIGERNLDHPEALARARDFVEQGLSRSGLEVKKQTFRVRSTDCENLEVEIPGRSSASEVVVIGAPYDSAPGTPGADDNATGVAALLALARRARASAPARTLRFVAFVNEEPPHFKTDGMGSVRYARRSREQGENVVAMLSLETIGYFDDREGSQKYPPPLGWFYPSRGDFIAFVGNTASRELVRRVVGEFRQQSSLASEGAALPGVIPGVGWSDHWSFWQTGYPAVMVTDTAPFRNPNYHAASDTADTLDFARLTHVVLGLERVLAELAR
jgi:Zn-dependent M28 family amino/carboxypeptidase